MLARAIALFRKDSMPTGLSPVALELASKKGPAWEYRLFGQVLSDEVAGYRDLIWSPTAEVRATIVPDANFLAWLLARMDVLDRLVAELNFMNGNHDAAFGPPGKPGNAQSITKMARRIAAIYRQAIEWTHSVRYADVDLVWREIAYEVSFFGECLMKPIEEFGPRVLRQIEEALRHPQTGPKDVLFKIVVDGIPNPNRVIKTLERLVNEIERGEVNFFGTFSAPGYICVLSSPSLGGLLKIGRTTQNPGDSMEELSSATGLRAAFEIAFYAYVEDAAKAEAYVNARLSSDRDAENPESFRIDLTTAIRAVKEAQRVMSE